MPLNTNSMDDAGLGKTTRLKYVKAISPTGAFPDPWGDDKPEMQKSASSSSKVLHTPADPLPGGRRLSYRGNFRSTR